MKYYIIAGEASGDLHGSNLIREIKALDPGAQFRAWGGSLMETAGAKLVKNYRDLAFMGFIEVVKNLPVILSNIKWCKEDILAYKPDALILVDYPGFNLRIATWAKKQGLTVIYYISPQVWAWKENRVKAIRKSVDKMIVILPFEKDFYRKWNYEVEYVGHPLAELIDNYKAEMHQAAILAKNNKGELTQIKKPFVALLPGSRKQEILVKLPLMLMVSSSFPDFEFVVAHAPGQDTAFYLELMTDYPNVSISATEGLTYPLLANARAALVTSGTATLETALFGVPEVVCYKGSRISYQIAKRLIKIKYISLVNLIMDKEVVKELIQDELTVENLKTELYKLLYDEAKKRQIEESYAALKKLLSEGGNASRNAALSIVSMLKERSRQ